MIGCAVALGETFCGGGIILGLIECLALPLRIDEALRGLGRALRLKQALALLIGA